jgi:hypothetical protein
MGVECQVSELEVVNMCLELGRGWSRCCCCGLKWQGSANHRSSYTLHPYLAASPVSHLFGQISEYSLAFCAFCLCKGIIILYPAAMRSLRTLHHYASAPTLHSIGARERGVRNRHLLYTCLFGKFEVQLFVDCPLVTNTAILDLPQSTPP